MARSLSTEEKLWQAARENPSSAYFNLPIAFQLEGALDANALERAFNDVIRRHDALRTVFEEADGRVTKRIAPEVTLRLVRRDAAAGSEHARGIEALLIEEADTPFDLQRGPLVRAGLLTRAPHDHVFFVTIHHAIFDQWSAAVLFHELSALYAAHVSGTPADLSAPTQLAVCARQQAEWLKTPDHDRQLQYWTHQLCAPLPVTEMPAAQPRSARASTGGTYEFEVPESLAARMTTVARAQRVTPFMLLLTSFMILMHRYTGDEDIAVASAVARRRTLEWQSVIGLLMNGVILRARVQNGDTCDAVLKRVRDAALQAYDNQEIPHSEVRRAVGAPETHEERARQVFFHCAPRVRPEFPGIESTIVPTATSCAKSDFGMSLYDEARRAQPVRWSGVVEYNDGLFDRPAIARIVEEFQDVLAKVCAEPGQRVGSVA